jgi:hypothetical protein
MAARFREGFAGADGVRIRNMEAGERRARHLHGAGGLRLTPAHELLSCKYRVVAFEMRGFGLRLSREPEQISLTDEHARIGQAIDNESHRLRKRNGPSCFLPLFGGWQFLRELIGLIFVRLLPTTVV